METNAKQQVVERIKQANNVLVTVSSNPNVDQLSAAIGLTLLLNKLGKHGTAVFSGQVPSAIEFLQPEKTIETTTDSLRDFIISLDKSKADKLRYKVEEDVVKIFITPYRTSITQTDLEFGQGDFNVDAVVALGVVAREELDQAIVAHGRILHDATVITAVSGEQVSNLGSINWQDANSSSLCEMLVSISEAFGNGLLDNQIATAFLTGIVSETERFKNAKTTPKVLTMSAQLVAAGANQQLIAAELEPQPEPPAPVVESEAVVDQPDVVAEAQPSVEPQPEVTPNSDEIGTFTIAHDPSERAIDISIPQPSADVEAPQNSDQIPQDMPESAVPEQAVQDQSLAPANDLPALPEIDMQGIEALNYSTHDAELHFEETPVSSEASAEQPLELPAIQPTVVDEAMPMNSEAPVSAPNEVELGSIEIKHDEPVAESSPAIDQPADDVSMINIDEHGNIVQPTTVSDAPEAPAVDQPQIQAVEATVVNDQPVVAPSEIGSHSRGMVIQPPTHTDDSASQPATPIMSGAMQDGHEEHMLDQSMSTFPTVTNMDQAGNAPYVPHDISQPAATIDDARSAVMSAIGSTPYDPSRPERLHAVGSTPMQEDAPVQNTPPNQENQAQMPPPMPGFPPATPPPLMPPLPVGGMDLNLPPSGQ